MSKTYYGGTSIDFLLTSHMENCRTAQCSEEIYVSTAVHIIPMLGSIAESLEKISSALENIADGTSEEDDDEEL